MNRRVKQNRINPFRIKPEHIRPHGQQTRVKSVTILSICTVLDVLCPNKPNYSTESAILMEWCLINNVHYYARPREDFFLIEAAGEAAARQQSFVVVEDMS